MNTFGAVLVLAAASVLSPGLYFLPSLIAARRHHHQDGPILVINLFLGWTGLGWVVALAWACGDIRKEPATD